MAASNLFLQLQDTIEQSLSSRRTPWYIDIHWNDPVTATNYWIGVVIVTATICTAEYRTEDKLKLLQLGAFWFFPPNKAYGSPFRSSLKVEKKTKLLLLLHIFNKTDYSKLGSGLKLNRVIYTIQFDSGFVCELPDLFEDELNLPTNSWDPIWLCASGILVVTIQTHENILTKRKLGLVEYITELLRVKGALE